MENALGILGGMGPMASDLLYRMITEKTPAKCDQDHLNILLVSDAGMPDRTETILEGSEEDKKRLDERLLSDIAIFEQNSCKAFCAACNTVHYFIDRIEERLEIPCIHMIRESAAYLSRRYEGGSVVLMATDGTLASGLYRKEFSARGVETLLLSSELQRLLMAEIYEGIKAGKPANTEFWRRAEEEIKLLGADVALLACTELSIAKRELGLSDFFPDALEITAEKAIEFMRSE